MTNTNRCGLYLGGTEAGRAFLGLTDDSKDSDKDALLAAMLSSGGSLLVFSPPFLTIDIDGSSNYTASFRSAVPASWTSDEVSVDIVLDYSSCPSVMEFSASPNPINFFGIFDPQQANASAHALGACVIRHTIGQGTSSTSGLTVGADAGILPVIVQQSKVQTSGVGN